jgi:endonuclease/exonuclease/phosphatase family metal-dependent hydrolase
VGGCRKFHGTIQDGNSFEEKEDTSYFSNELASHHADFVALQEPLTPKDTGALTQTAKINNILRYKYFENHPFTIRESHIEKGAYLSIGNIANLDVIKTYFHATPNPNLKKVRPNGDTWLTLDYGFLVSEVKYQNIEIAIANTILVPFHYFDRSITDGEFQYIRDDITDFFLKLSQKPSIVLGDFNFAKLKDTLPQIFESSLFSEAFENVETAPGKGQQDHILFSRQWKLLNKAIKKLEADHYLCEAELELN